MTIKSTTDLQTDLTNNIFDNATGRITELTLRRFLVDVLDSVPVMPETFRASDVTGTTDVAGELQDFINANAGKQVYIPSGIYKLASAVTLSPSAGVDLWLSPFAVMRYAAGHNAIYYDNTANAGASQAISAITTATINTTAYVTRLTVEDASVFAKGDYVHMHSQDRFRPNGEFAGGTSKVHSVDVANDYVYLTDVLPYAADLSTSPLIRKLDRTRPFALKGGEFIADGDWTDTSITSRKAAIELIGVVGIDINDQHGRNLWRDNIIMRTCAKGDVRNMSTVDGPDFEDDAENLVPCYGVTLYGACYDIKVEDCRGAHIRHLTTTGGQENQIYNANNWEFYGWPDVFSFSNNTCDSMNGTGIDTHEPGFRARLHDNTVTNGKRGYDDGTSGGYGISLRCASASVEGNIFDGCEGGIQILAVDIGRPAEYDIGANTYQNLDSANDADAGLSIQNMSALAANRRPIVTLNGGIFRNVGRAISVGQMATLRTGGTRMYGVDWGFDLMAGSTVIGDAGYMDFRDNKRAAPHYAVYARSDGSNGGAKALFTHCTINKGDATNKPSAFFHEGDTTANKEYKLLKLDEINLDGVTSTMMVSAGATTMVESTALSEVT